eukprot:162080-Rhodomonas_salina.1
MSRHPSAALSFSAHFSRKPSAAFPRLPPATPPRTAQGSVPLPAAAAQVGQDAGAGQEDVAMEEGEEDL